MGAPGVSYKKRLLAALGVIATIFVVLIGRLFYIQVVQSDELQERALSQWTRDTSLSAARGSILDTTGVVLAQSGTAYKVVIWPNSIDAVERTRVATELAELLGLEYETVLAKVSDTKKQEIILARRVEREVIDPRSQPVSSVWASALRLTQSGIILRAPCFPNCWASRPWMVWDNRGSSRNMTNTLPARTDA